jgi:hypothetical protein
MASERPRRLLLLCRDGRMFSSTVVTDWSWQTDALRDGAYGLIEVRDERLVGVSIRPFARRVSRIEAFLWGRLSHRLREGNHCWLYYRQPRRFPGFLVLDYVISARHTTLGTARGALVLLEEIARLKGSDALLCDVATARISERLLSRWDWAPHAGSRWHRNYIKRFYGRYPDRDPLVDVLLASDRPRTSAAQLALCR